MLLDYSLAYARAWQRAFGVMSAEREPKAYWPIDRWAVDWLSGERLVKLKACFDEEFWSTIPPLAGALKASRQLASAGYRLVCDNAIKRAYSEFRRQNLINLGFPLEEVVATG